MHKSSIKRIQWFIEQYLSVLPGDEKLKVLDVGSYDVNGSYRSLFPEDRFIYKGLDMAEGPNVDYFIKNPYHWPDLETDSFDVVISGQAFEHIEFFWITLAEMTRVLKKGGLMCIIVPRDIQEHRYPVDCYRFLTDGMVSLARYVSLEPLHAHTNLAPKPTDSDWYSKCCADSMLIARKNYSGNTRYVDIKTYQCIPPDHKVLNDPLVPKAKSVKRILIIVTEKIGSFFSKKQIPGKRKR